MKTRDDLLESIRAERASWHALLDEVGEVRMEQPGPMGDWTFKDLVGHLHGWRERTIARLEAGPGGEPATPWPAHLTDTDEIGTDEINDWIYEQHRDRPLRDVLADAERSFERLEAAVKALSDEDLTTPGRFSWLDGKALVDIDLFAHLHEEHEPQIRTWLAAQ
jgi:hypothetical protein